MKLTQTQIVEAALELLNSEGLDAVTTRKLAQHLHVESPALYWHFRDKAALFQAMSSAVMQRHHVCPPPGEAPTDRAAWLGWYADNARSFRTALLRYRDGARLHAGTEPGPTERGQLRPKLVYMMRGGLSEEQAGMALYIASQLTLGAVLEEQAGLDLRSAASAAHTAGPTAGPTADRDGGAETPQEPAERRRPPWSSEEAFEFGLDLLLSGLALQYRAPEA